MPDTSDNDKPEFKKWVHDHRRERIATAALQGILAARTGAAVEEAARYAVEYADAMMRELDKSIGEPTP